MNREEQNEILLERAAELIDSAWNSTNVFVKGVPWETVAGRWMSDYERRDEWIDPDDDQQG